MMCLRNLPCTAGEPPTPRTGRRAGETSPRRRTRRFGRRPFITAALLGASAFIIYQTTFIGTPRLFLFPEVGIWSADIPEYAAALRGRPNEEDMRKHLLYYPVGRALYALVDRARIRLGVNRDTAALVFPAALSGASSVFLAYFLFRRFSGARAAAASAALYAFTYSTWILSSVTESYATTTLAVNLFFLVALAGGGRGRARWYSAWAALALLCCLLDLRSIFLLAIPLYIAAAGGGAKRARSLVSTILLAAAVVVLTGAAYGLYSRFSGRPAFGVLPMLRWLGALGSSERSGLAEGASLWTSAGGVLLTFFVESISPLRRAYMDGSPAATAALQAALSLSFLAVSAVLLCGSYRRVWECLRARTEIQAVACWLAAYSLFHLYYSPWSSGRLIFSNPVVLPLLLLLLPGICGSWGGRKAGRWLLGSAAVLLLGNNLVLVNEARSAWQAPGIVQSPADRVYMLPGEPARLNYLAHKGASSLPVKERERFLLLAAKSGSEMSGDEWKEINALALRAFCNLPGSERGEALDIFRRNMEAFRLSAGHR